MRIPPEPKFPVAGAQRQGTALLRSSWLAGLQETLVEEPAPRFTTHQQRIISYLPEIDATLAAAGKDQNWLHRQIETAPFIRRSPIQHMLVRFDRVALALPLAA
jgi:hypothetical protein